MAFTVEKMMSFEVRPLPQELVNKMVEVGVWKPECPVAIDRLRLVRFIHYSFSAHKKQGEIVVLEVVAERVLEIFKSLFQYQFPIECAQTIEKYRGSDRASMAANNTCAFNYRPIAGKSLLSIHSYGLAIDINPIQNPCLVPQEIVNEEEVLIPVQPAKGQAYLNRTKVREGMVEQMLDKSNEMRVVELFQKHGFYVWGGQWNDPVDWQHFQPSRGAAEWLAFMSPEDGSSLFELYNQYPDLLNNQDMRKFDFKSLYEKNRDQFILSISSPEFWQKSPREAYKILSKVK